MYVKNSFSPSSGEWNGHPGQITAGFTTSAGSQKMTRWSEFCLMLRNADSGTLSIMKKRLKRPLIVFTITVIIIVAVVIIFISPLTKYLIQKYDEKYTGRQITLDWALVNPFSGYVHLHNLKIYEYKSDSVFLAANGLTVRVSLLKLFSHHPAVKQRIHG
ncbi:MAG: hypothetical protein WDM78_03005 [Puia sp.]